MAADPNNPQQKVADSKQSGSTYAFPDQNTLNNQAIQIDIVKYKRGNPLSPPNKSDTIAHIHLPLPMSGLEDNISLNYEETALGAAGALAGALVNPLNNVAGKAEAGAGAVLLFAAQSAVGAAGDYAAEKVGEGAGLSGLASSISKVAGQSKDAISIGAGVALNPNLSLLFQGVKMRTHTFSWRFIAKSQSETNTIDSIVKTLKKNALPSQIGGSGSYFAYGYPAIALLSFTPAELIKMSEFGCFMDSVSVKYDGQGYPAFFNQTNKPVVIDLSVTFRERAVLTSQDYT